jgi:hypothetical protein
VAWSVPQRPSLVLIAAALGAAGCGGGHGDDLASATKCLRDHDAHQHAAPPVVSHSFSESGWRTRTFAVGDNGLVVVATNSDAAAREARRRLAQAAGANHSQPQQRGRLVYVWDDPPSASDRAVARACLA